MVKIAIIIEKILFKAYLCIAFLSNQQFLRQYGF